MIDAVNQSCRIDVVTVREWDQIAHLVGWQIERLTEIASVLCFRRIGKRQNGFQALFLLRNTRKNVYDHLMTERYLLDVVLEIVELLKRFGGDVDVQPKCEQITVRAAELLLHFFQRLLALPE